MSPPVFTRTAGAVEAMRDWEEVAEPSLDAGGGTVMERGTGGEMRRVSSRFEGTVGGFAGRAAGAAAGREGTVGDDSPEGALPAVMRLCEGEAGPPRDSYDLVVATEIESESRFFEFMLPTLDMKPRIPPDFFFVGD